jgi:hypothetical protein
MKLFDPDPAIEKRIKPFLDELNALEAKYGLSLMIDDERAYIVQLKEYSKEERSWQ